MEQERPNRKGTFRKFVESTFAFNRMGFTLMFVLVYFVGMSWIASTEDQRVPALNKQYPIGYSQDAYTDLQVISKTFHPFNSKANDEVHDYLLSQVQKIKKGNVEVVDDVRHELFAQTPVFDSVDYDNAIYSENNNILVRIPGENDSLPGVLLSAHYDSVATGHGTIDDGTGVVSLLATLRYFVDNNIKPKRTLVFNFNNNEEPGLIGAEMFMFHPWAKQVEYFINLEGAGAFGRPILFRATDYGVAKHYDQAGNSVLQQGFESGVVGSQTDYKVYQKKGMRGLDIAFYKARSLYHTKRDNIHASSVEAISQMFAGTVTATMGMANDVDMADMDKPVYMDMFGKLFMISTSSLIKWNVAGLVAGPIIVGLLLTLACKAHAWDVGARGWARGVVSLAASSALTVFCSVWMFKMNPNVTTSQLYAPLVVLLSVFLLTNYAILGLAYYVKPVHDQKLILFIQVLVLEWAALVYTTVRVGRDAATGLYLPTILYYLTLSAVVLGFLGLLVARPKIDHHPEPAVGASGGADHEPTDADERTSLLSENRDNFREQHPRLARLKQAAQNSLSYDWSIQFLVVVPLGLAAVFSVACVVLDALHDTQPDRSQMFGMMPMMMAGFAIALGLLVVPFIHRTHFFLALVLIIVVVMAGFKVLFFFPFTQTWPLASMVVQQINLDANPVTPIVKVVSPVASGYVLSALKTLPSLKNQEIKCEESSTRSTCEYQGMRPWSVGLANYSEWMKVEVVPIAQSPNSGRIRITAPDNRVCQIQFNTTSFESGMSNSPVRKISVFPDMVKPSPPEAPVPVPEPAPEPNVTTITDKHGATFPHGANELSIYTLNATQSVYNIGFDWIPSWFESDRDDGSNKLGLTVTCSWSEYDEQILVGDKLERKMPALDEILEYAPEWTSWRKLKTGLVEVSKYVEL